MLLENALCSLTELERVELKIDTPTGYAFPHLKKFIPGAKINVNRSLSRS